MLLTNLNCLVFNIAQGRSTMLQGYCKNLGKFMAILILVSAA
jgi:hypothetical protein